MPKGNDKAKYLVCNADESEPGSFKDRLLLERAPNQMLEGILIGAKAIGAETSEADEELAPPCGCKRRRRGAGRARGDWSSPAPGMPVAFPTIGTAASMPGGIGGSICASSPPA